MLALWIQDEKYTGMLFVIPHEKPGKSKEGKYDKKVGEEEDYHSHIHWVILQTCVPGLFELCEPFDKETTVTLSIVTPAVFNLLLSYIYGRRITFTSWKEHSHDLIDSANRYSMSDLKLEAEAWHVKFTTITAENAVDLLLYADAKNCAVLCAER